MSLHENTHRCFDRHCLRVDEFVGRMILPHVVELVGEIRQVAGIEERILRIFVSRTVLCCHLIFFLVVKLAHIVNILYRNLEDLVALC